LALSEGYWSLSASRISKAAGVPATHFKLHFRDVDDAYLDSIDQLARGLFEPFGSWSKDGTWTESVCRQVSSVVNRARGEEGAARLVLSQIVAPGIRGATYKEQLIDDLAAGWAASLHPLGRAAAEQTRTSVAGLWEVLSRATAATGVDRLRDAAPTCAYLVLAPIVGEQVASKAVERTFARRPRPCESLAVDVIVPN
jgi:AcrR family transcriptional regulator